MSKAVLCLLGIALFVISANYFVSIDTVTVTANPASTLSPTPVKTLSRQSSPSEPIPIEVVPLAANPADSLRFALESVVEESIEQELWDEMESKTKNTLGKLNNPHNIQ